MCSQPHKPAKGHIYSPHAGTRSEHASTRLQVPAPDLLRSRVGLGGGGVLGGSASTRLTTNQLLNHLASSANHQSAARVKVSVSIQNQRPPQTGLGGDTSQASSPGAGGHEHRLSLRSEDAITGAPPICRLQLAARLRRPSFQGHFLCPKVVQTDSEVVTSNTSLPTSHILI